MRNKTLVLATVLVVTSLVQAGPALVFFDDFDSENGGVGVYNYTGFSNWTVAEGDVDLLGQPAGFHDFFPAYGLYVDTDGTGSGAGTLVSHPIDLQPGTYSLSFDLAGSQRDYGTDPEYVIAQVNSGTLLSKTYSLPWYEPFQTFTESFVLVDATVSTISFSALGDDWVGMLLDNVTLTAESAVIPAPSAILLSSIGAGLVGWLSRRRRV